MVYRAQALILFSLILSACAGSPDYPVPPQKQMPVGSDPLPSAPLIAMSDPGADSFVIQDVLGAEPGTQWRWTNQHPRLKIWADPDQRWSFYVRFTLPGVVLKQTGPIAISFFLNDQVLETKRFDKEQEYEYSKPIAPDLLKRDDPNIAGLDLDRTFVSPTDGVKLGVLLQEIGFKLADHR